MPQFNLQEEVIAISNPADLPLYSIENELDLDSLSAREVDDVLESELTVVSRKELCRRFLIFRGCRGCGAKFRSHSDTGSLGCVS